jgi:hypothetical protein
MKLSTCSALIALVALAAQEAGSSGARPAKLPEVGKPAPPIRLNDQSGKIVTLGGKAANWSVLAFFPKAMTPG